MDIRIPKGLYTINPYVFICKLLILAAIVVPCVTVIVMCPWYSAVPAQVILGVMFAHSVELQHQCLHRTAFRDKQLNRMVGVLLGLPMIVSFSHYRTRHLKHHRFVGTPQDTEFFSYNHQEIHSWRTLAIHAFSLRRYPMVLWNVRDALLNRRSPDARNALEARHIRQEYHLLALAVVAGVVFTGVYQTTLVVALWLVPLIFIAEPAHFLIELPEHFLCDRPVRDVMTNTRTIVASRFMFWLTNGNNFHVEHHYSPQIPVERLPELHSLLAPQIKHCQATYWRFLRQVTSCATAAERFQNSPATTRP